ncbi:MAG: hypothetical protein USCGTAYLOR_02444 [Chromatiales bacterium USCg_Taylor]|nr:MAG: hypothetical protein USCGTAYLOR_02444 [Chromatiales bacterium USCg_Taylor]
MQKLLALRFISSTRLLPSSFISRTLKPSGAVYVTRSQVRAAAAALVGCAARPALVTRAIIHRNDRIMLSFLS